MGSRRVYREIEEAALLGGFGDSGCPHTQIARRLRHLYRESRDIMSLSISSVNVTASVYGNPGLDAKRGFKSLTERLAKARGMIFYMGDAVNKKQFGSVNRGIRLLKELNKRLTPEVLKRYHESRGDYKDDDQHVLGGVRK